VQRVNQILLTAIRTPDVRARLTGQGAEVVTMTPAETDKFFNAERARWRTVVQTSNLQLD
ncbi:MAG: tripartite tricarboxylate transporter substrate binding protein, partial [Comamonas sp.]